MVSTKLTAPSFKGYFFTVPRTTKDDRYLVKFATTAEQDKVIEESLKINGNDKGDKSFDLSKFINSFYSLGLITELVKNRFLRYCSPTFKVAVRKIDANSFVQLDMSNPKSRCSESICYTSSNSIDDRASFYVWNQPLLDEVKQRYEYDCPKEIKDKASEDSEKDKHDSQIFKRIGDYIMDDMLKLKPYVSDPEAEARAKAYQAEEDAKYQERQSKPNIWGVGQQTTYHEPRYQPPYTNLNDYSSPSQPYLCPPPIISNNNCIDGICN